MIRISCDEATTARLLPSDSAEVEYHSRYGFVTRESLERRRRLRIGAGLSAPMENPEFTLQIAREGNATDIRVSSPARVEPLGTIGWKLSHLDKTYFVDFIETKKSATLPHFKTTDRTGLIGFALLLLAGFIAGAFWFLPKQTDAVQAKTQEQEAPVLLHEQPQVKPVEPPKPKEIPDPQAKAKRALTQQLGFLKLIGRKDLKKAVGGLPTEVAHATAGAGPGGDAGSGGELLAGLGRGLHKTTVGNTGVSGLGGVGTHGAGGGAGGYGDTSFGGAGGRTLSAVPLAQDAAIDDGLDRSQIQATIMRYLSQVRACYEEGLKRDANLIGQVTMSFEISGEGTVKWARVGRSSLNDRTVESCISGKMMFWKFPQPRNGKSVGVSYPFMLRPVSS